MLDKLKLTNLGLAVLALILLGSLIGCDEGKSGGSGKVSSPDGVSILCDRAALTESDYIKCIEENRSALSGNGWIGILKVTNKGQYEDLLEDTRICDISGWWSLDDDCSDWDNEVGVIIDADRLEYPADATVSVIALGSGSWSFGSTVEKYLRNMTGEIEAINTDTNGAIQQQNVRLVIKHAALIDGDMTVELRYENEVVAKGTMVTFDDWF